ncbi:MAG: mechanosensitive ion channel [Gammaproteobacteria bacterium]
MPRWIVVALALLCGLVGPALGQVKLPLLPGGLEGKPEQIKVDTLPEPTALQAGWWHYFDAKGDELKNRVRATLDRLEALATSLPTETLQAARPSIELTKANLLALPEARAQSSLKPPAPPAFATTYTVSQLLDIARQLRSTRAELGTGTLDVDMADKGAKSVIRRVDTLFAAYLNLTPTDPKRVLRGLEIMAEHTTLLVAEERLRVSKAELQAAETRAQQLEEELAAARERLTANGSDLIRLDNAIAEAQANVERAHEHTLKEQTGALSVVGNSEEDKATAPYRQQRVIRAAVQEAISRVDLIAMQSELQLTGLKLNIPGTNFQALRADVTAWNTELAELQKQIDSWTVDSERERSRTGSAAAAAGVEQQADVKPPLAVTLINQDRFKLAQETLVAIQRLRDEITRADLVIQLTENQLLAKEGRLQDWLARAEQLFQQAWKTAAGWINISLFKIGETPVTTVGLLRIALILTIAWWISHWLRRALQRLGERGDGSNLPALYTIGRLSHYLLIILGFLVGLSSIGMDFTNFALVAGALAIGIGFGLQAIVNNFMSGLILLFERSLKVGDFIELATGLSGEVKAINVRSTLINTNDDIDIVVPNSQFMNNNLTNWTLLNAYRRIHLPFRAVYGSDKELVRKAGLEAAEKVPHTLSGIPGKNPSVWLVGFGENGLDFELVVWLTPRAVKRPSAVRAAYMWELETALRKYAIEVPIPQRDLRLRGGIEPAVLSSAPSLAEVKLEKPVELKSSVVSAQR